MSDGMVYTRGIQNRIDGSDSLVGMIMTLEIKNLSKRGKDGWNFVDVSFSVKKGEIFGILASDEEKTAEILRILSGLVKPDSGEIIYNDHQVLNGRKEGFFYLGDETISRWRNLFSSKSAQGRAKTHADLVLESLVDLKNVFLIENPVQILDTTRTREIAEAIKTKTAEMKLCTVIATNDPLEVFQLCDRVGILYKGEIIQIGTPREVYSFPNSIQAAKIFGNNNFIAAKRLTSNKTDTPEFFTIDGEHKLTTGKVDKRALGPINQTVTLSIRPECISISFGASFPEDNLLKAKVTKIEFQGATTVSTLDANGLILKAVVLRIVGLDIGEECMVGLPPDRIRILTN